MMSLHWKILFLVSFIVHFTTSHPAPESLSAEAEALRSEWISAESQNKLDAKNVKGFTQSLNGEMRQQLQKYFLETMFKNSLQPIVSNLDTTNEISTTTETDLDGNQSVPVDENTTKANIYKLELPKEGGAYEEQPVPDIHSVFSTVSDKLEGIYKKKFGYTPTANGQPFSIDVVKKMMAAEDDEGEEKVEVVGANNVQAVFSKVLASASEDSKKKVVVLKASHPAVNIPPTVSSPEGNILRRIAEDDEADEDKPLKKKGASSNKATSASSPESKISNDTLTTHSESAVAPIAPVVPNPPQASQAGPTYQPTSTDNSTDILAPHPSAPPQEEDEDDDDDEGEIEGEDEDDDYSLSDIVISGGNRTTRVKRRKVKTPKI